MKHIVRKPYWNYEKEEKWLNEMSAKGLALVDYSWCRYVFEEAEQSEYTYRIEYLKYFAKHEESKMYIKFLEENGIECVATYMHWIYLRKKTSEGEFDIYSDIDCKINHAKRIFGFWSGLVVLEFFAGISNLAIAIAYYIEYKEIVVNLGLGIFLTTLGIVFLTTLSLPTRKKIKHLQQERVIRE